MADDSPSTIVVGGSGSSMPNNLHENLELKLYSSAPPSGSSITPQPSGSHRVVVVGDSENHSGVDDDEAGGSGLCGPVGGEEGVTNEEPSFNLRLIEAVRQSRCLYDSSDRQYRSADHKIKVWNRLVQHLCFTGDARTLYNRWKQLRDKYGKEKKKLKYNGDISQWQYYKHLEFLDPHMVDRTQQKYERTKDGKLICKEPRTAIVINDPNFALHLINEVRLQPCLFDIKDSKYRHTEFRNQAWSDIIKSLDFPGDINAIYKQWKKIRDRYVREKRKMRMSANGEQEEPTWELYRELLWIDPFLEERAAQVKRKRESSELSDDIYMDDFNNLGSRSVSLREQQQSQQHQQQQQQYAAMVMPNSLDTSTVEHIQQHLEPNKQPIEYKPAPLQGTSRNMRGGLPGASAATILANGTTLMMQPVLSASHQPVAASQQLIITNEPLGGDRAYALSVQADLRALPEHARNMASAQIQHLLENSKITIVKA